MSDECVMYSPDPNHAFRYVDIIEYAKKSMIDDVSRCIQSGHDINAKDYYGVTAIQVAAENNNFSMLRILIEAGAKLVEQNDGTTVLGWAKYHENKEMIEFIENV